MDGLHSDNLSAQRKQVVFVSVVVVLCVCVKGEAEEFAQLVKWSPQATMI